MVPILNEKSCLNSKNITLSVKTSQYTSKYKKKLKKWVFLIKYGGPERNSVVFGKGK